MKEKTWRAADLSNLMSKDPETAKVVKEMEGWLNTFHRIEEKNRCVRVRFLDWLAAKLASWSVRVKTASDRIHSPCFIKVGEKNHV